MNNHIVIKVNNLTKTYHLYDKPQDRLKEALHPFRKSYHHDFHALNDVSFEIKKGEIVGVIGKNGAGKSTLLKIITGVLSPTSGSVEVIGKVASLLELGAGFNPEMSGIENIYLNGTIMGFTKKEMDMKVNTIIEFADIGEFIHQQVKTYSSGMFARLAFSVAINVKPDVLIVDEALSVGDMSFQAKSMVKMKDLMNKGTTVLFVSHDIGAIQSLCKKVIYIDDGQMIAYNNVDDVTSLYLKNQQKSTNIELSNYKLNIPLEDTEVSERNKIRYDFKKLDLTGKKVFKGTRSGNNKAKILDFKLLNHNGDEIDKIESNSKYIIQIAVKFNEDLASFAIVCPIRSLNGTQEIGVSSAVEKFMFPSVVKNEIYFVEIESNMNLKDGVYNLVIAVEIPLISNVVHEFADVMENCLTFNVFWNRLKFPTKFYTSGDIRYKKVEED